MVGVSFPLLLIFAAFFVPWVVSSVPTGVSSARGVKVSPNVFSSGQALEGSLTNGWFRSENPRLQNWWGAPIAPGWVLVLAIVILALSVLCLMRWPRESILRGATLASSIAGLLLIWSAVSSIRQSSWLDKNYLKLFQNPYGIKSYSVDVQAGSKIALAAGVFVVLVSIGALVVSTGVFGRKSKFMNLEAQPRLVRSDTTELVIQDAHSDERLIQSKIVNASLFLAVALIGLLPLLTIGALGMSVSLNAFKVDEGDGQRFWLTGIPAGWVVVAISVVAFGVIALASKKSSRTIKRTENHVLAGFGLIIGAVLIASWYYANKQLKDAMGAAVGELVADGNPFAVLGGAMVGGISFSPAIGFWLMLAVALAIAGYNVFLIRETKKPTSPIADIPNTSLADGIRELSELRDQGLISEEEFTLAKRKLLGE